MKWTDEYNEAIIRIYYKITQCEKNKIAYRKLLHQEFINQFPHLSHLTEQRISDQRRLILHKKYLSVDRLELIKNDLQEQHNDIQANDNSILQIGITDNEDPDTESLDLNAENHTTNENENLHREKIIAIDEMFAKALEYFANTNPTERQFIPKQRSSKKLSKIVAYTAKLNLKHFRI
ncbi:unnamed protein product [Parnassius apollo]|uniref:(apollo) hypothetical protein n=1 Tax=Parnassius apollo TaxID=110799 RepID=A0A8S3W2K4_PARAO|nr:unnamed protein product [Parnassius apollo]